MLTIDNCRLSQSGQHLAISVPTYIILIQIENEKSFEPRIPYFWRFSGSGGAPSPPPPLTFIFLYLWVHLHNLIK